MPYVHSGNPRPGAMKSGVHRLSTRTAFRIFPEVSEVWYRRIYRPNVSFMSRIRRACILMRKSASPRRAGFLAAAVLLALLASSCLPAPTSESDGLNLIVYGFSITKESLEKSVYPGFSAKWKSEHGQQVNFTSSFAGSETITNQILQGVKAEIAILSIERDVDRLIQGGFVTADWHALP